MLEIVMKEALISFDGRVLEIFRSQGETLRFHVKLIQSLELKQGRRRYTLEMSYTEFNMPFRLGFDEAFLAQMEQLMREIQGQLS